MFSRVRALLLRLLRVPPEPQAPFGHPSSIRIFRAGRKFYWLRLVRWGFVQTAALGGIVFWLAVIAVSEHEANRMRAQGPGAGRLSQLTAGRNKLALGPLRNVSPAVFNWLWVAKGLGLILYLAQLGVTYTALRLDYELRWYIVTDRSLRIRWGVWRVQETTMSYANLQQVVVAQGPLERLLGISNVRVESAGGGRKESGSGEAAVDTMHTGVFHGVENAAEIRDLILDRLRRFRESGLGDPEEAKKATLGTDITPASAAIGDLLTAGQDLLGEARKLRATLVGR